MAPCKRNLCSGNMNNDHYMNTLPSEPTEPYYFCHLSKGSVKVSFDVDLNVELTREETTSLLRRHAYEDSSVFLVDPDSVEFGRVTSGRWTDEDNTQANKTILPLVLYGSIWWVSRIFQYFRPHLSLA